MSHCQRLPGYLNLGTMLRNKIVIYLLPLVLLVGCIKQFSPEIESDIASKVVVSGKLTNKEGYQSVKLSKSIPIADDYIYQPLSFCRVSIWDENGNEFQMYEHQSGEYGVWMNSANLKIGSAYYIQIYTPEGDELRSDPDIMTAVAPACIPAFQIDSIYNQAFDYYTKGLRFKVNVDGNETTSKYYLFELDPTYEHHVKYAREWYYNGGSVRHIYPPDSSLMYCWTTERVPEIFTLSTENLSANKFNNFNLHFVPYNTNLERVIARLIGLKTKKGPKLQKEIQNLFIQKLIFNEKVSFRGLNEALMDLGRTFCQARKASCELCALKKTCKAFELGTPLKFPVNDENEARKSEHELHLLRVIVKKKEKLLVKEIVNGNNSTYPLFYTQYFLPPSHKITIRQRSTELSPKSGGWQVLPKNRVRLSDQNIKL